jgi:hypothetical protein
MCICTPRVLLALFAVIYMSIPGLQCSDMLHNISDRHLVAFCEYNPADLSRSSNAGPSHFVLCTFAASPRVVAVLIAGLGNWMAEYLFP